MKALVIALTLTLSFSTLARKSEDNLTLKDAIQRKSQVGSVNYELHFEFDKKIQDLKGKAKINLEMKRLDLPLSIDFVTKKIVSITINGTPLKKWVTRIGSIDIPKNALTSKMQVEITYIGEYTKASSGLNRVIDPEDGNEYIYTDFEPYYAHTFYPCLDQPDLKAKFKVSVLAPKDWKIIHNELVESQKEMGDKALTEFRQTPMISTYLFFLGAGPFVEWKDSFDDLPIYLYARKSMEKYVDVDNIMRTTKLGLGFFNDYFGFPYPFSKYGQIFIPEFAWGGMENPGAVTLNERNIFRGPVPKSRFENRDDLILHEMAHMWFGDLVTMEWWNDLWLNESFATYLASLGMEYAMHSKFTWTDFFRGKNWGYWQDQLVTTHPIETPVRDITEARGNFDGITYAKGASSLKQLHFFVGDKGFKDGLRAYFKEFAWKNTTRADFINAIAKASEKDLTDWTNKWLQTAGPNRIKVNLVCKEDKIINLSLIQTANVSKAISPHRTKISLYEKDDEELDLLSVQDVTIMGDTKEIEELKGKKCPDFIFPNYEDKDYALYSLDDRSLENTKLALMALPDPLSRLMLWYTLSQMMKDTQITAGQFFDFALPALAQEEDELLLEGLLGKHSILKSHFEHYLTKEERTVLAPQIESLLEKKLLEAKEGSSIQMSLFDFYISIAKTPESQVKIFEMLTKNTPPKGIVLDQDRRWSLLLALATSGHKDALKLLHEEKQKDNSTVGKRTALAAQSAWPELTSKKKIWNEIWSNQKLTHSDLMEIGSNFHNTNYLELSSPFTQDFFKRISTMEWKGKDDKAEFYFGSLFPISLCSEELVSLSRRSLKKAQKLTSLSKRSWLEAQDELERCVRVRNFSKAHGPKSSL